MADQEKTVWITPSPEISDEEFHKIAVLTNKHFGIKLGPDKKALVLNRLHHVLRDKELKTINEYADYLEKSGDVEALKDFACRITTNHTYFYRETEHFKFLVDKAIPEFIQKHKGHSDKPFSIWSAGCSSGEEAYTLAIILAEYSETKKVCWNAKILATDLSEKMIKQAPVGAYNDTQLKYLPVLLKCKYFDRSADGTWHVKDCLKKRVSFDVFNLMTPRYPFNAEFDAIFCRNVLIYFDEKNRNDIINKFSRCQPGGAYLFISHSEVIAKEHPSYQYAIPAVYKKCDGI